MKEISPIFDLSNLHKYDFSALIYNHNLKHFYICKCGQTGDFVGENETCPNCGNALNSMDTWLPIEHFSRYKNQIIEETSTVRLKYDNIKNSISIDGGYPSKTFVSFETFQFECENFYATKGGYYYDRPINFKGIVDYGKANGLFKKEQLDVMSLCEKIHANVKQNKLSKRRLCAIIYKFMTADQVSSYLNTDGNALLLLYKFISSFNQNKNVSTEGLWTFFDFPFEIQNTEYGLNEKIINFFCSTYCRFNGCHPEIRTMIYDLIVSGTIEGTYEKLISSIPNESEMLYTPSDVKKFIEKNFYVIRSSSLNIADMLRYYDSIGEQNIVNVGVAKYCTHLNKHLCVNLGYKPAEIESVLSDDTNDYLSMVSGLNKLKKTR